MEEMLKVYKSELGPELVPLTVLSRSFLKKMYIFLMWIMGVMMMMMMMKVS